MLLKWNKDRIIYSEEEDGSDNDSDGDPDFDSLVESEFSEQSIKDLEANAKKRMSNRENSRGGLALRRQTLKAENKRKKLDEYLSREVKTAFDYSIILGTCLESHEKEDLLY